ncbi:glycosyltransferase family 2 protein [Leuconostoc gasicomitatum]|uniref:Glycosyltransferase family 2 protein n=1 Tax=Leuconostoc gasicomitatum TaxID=115778 RepID=A0A9Q3SWT1_9LACO|nr:glycosyltransferase family 2 protein [Leuconostoc gasicomitatum]MBZ5963221.1 glycosyltransferase family 2 protein [Leuconostoc gasicomitatum]
MNQIINRLLLPIIGTRRQLKNAYSFGLKKCITILNNKSKNYDYTLVLTAIVKDEDDYLLEWVSYHKVIGVDHIILYDNSEDSKTSKILRKFIDINFVEVISYPGRARQLEAYMDSARRFKNIAEWIMILDLDEFLTPLQNSNIKVFLQDFPFSTSQILISWLIYGSNGQINKSEGLVLERFTRHAGTKSRWDYKPIVRPERVISIEIPHYFEVIGKTVNEDKKRFWVYPYVTNELSPINNPQKFRINHYYTKSKEEFDIKKNKGFADQTFFSNIVRNQKDFLRQNRNELSDNTMKKWLPNVKKTMKKFQVEDNNE